MRARYILARLLSVIFVLIGLTTITFAVSRVIPSDPARLYAGPMATEVELEAARRYLGLDKPWFEQYYTYFVRLFAGDLGLSVLTRRPVALDLADRLPATIELAVYSFLLALVLGIGVGIVCAAKKDTKTDHVIRVLSLVGVGMPAFWLALVFQLVFSLHLGTLPASGRLDLGVHLQSITGIYTIDSILTGNLSALLSALGHLILPSLVLGLIQMSNIARVTRASMLEVINQDYIKTAKAKGLSSRTVLLKHAFRNAMIPTSTILGLTFGQLLAGAVLVETVFAWPGVGKYATDAIIHMDFPAVMGATILMCITYTVANLVIDLLYTVIDPRIK